MITKRQISRCCGLLLLIISLQSCYQNSTSCLDIFANNFQPTADLACEDCCRYPTISVGQVAFRAGDVSFSFADTLFNDMDSFKIINAGFYLHDFSLNTASTAIIVEESSNFWFDEGGNTSLQSLKTDMAAISPLNGTTYQLGTHKRRETTTGINFTLGLPTFWNDLIQDSIPEGNQLSASGNALYNGDSGYATAFMQIVSDFETGDTVLYQLPTTEWTAAISLDTSFLINYGDNIAVPIQIDLLAWTAGIDFEADGQNMELIKENFVKNIPNSISLNN